MKAREFKKKAEQMLRITICIVLVAVWFQIVTNRVLAQECPDPAPQTSGTHSFRRIGETLEIPISLGDCQATSLIVRWSNGRNNGSLIKLTFYDSDDHALYSKQFSTFQTGMREFPLMPVEQQQQYGMMSVSSVPVLVTVQAVYPFGAPAVLHYTIARAGRPVGRRRGIDSKLASNLQSAPGNALFSASSYSLTQLPLPEPRELEVPGRRKTVRNAFRLMLSPATVAAAQNGIDLIWIDDIAVPSFRNGAEVGALIFDEAVLRNGAEISVSDLAANRFQSLAERLNYQARSANRSELAMTEEGNVVVGIKNVARVIGGRRQPLVQLQLRTERPFPAREKALQLQVGKSLFLDELSGDHTGRNLTLTVTPEMFAELKDGASILAFYGKPDGSSSSGMNVWYFGTLNKSVIE